MLRRTLVYLAVSVCLLPGAVPTPKEHLGYEPGTDYKLADYNDLIGYFHKLAGSTDRLRLVEFGKTAMGKPTYLAYISSPQNLQALEHYKGISRKLALGEATPEDARRLAEEGKAIVWIDSGLHASEVAPAQHAPELAYRMITDESQEIRRIRDKVILLQVPCINPDGLDWIVHWYRQNVGGPYELAQLPRLYQKYAGHDNNRDYFMFNLPETRNVAKLLFHEWFPQIVYNQHQSPAFPARIFVPPYAEPLNPHIPAALMEGINVIGSAMKERFARENKPGVLSYFGYDAWWNGGLRSSPAFHNMHGILTETALHSYATPNVYDPKLFPERFGNGMPTKESTVFYQRPWLGGKWGVRDAIEYMLTADFAILDLAASRPSHFLYKAWEMARANIEAGEKGKPYAYVVPQNQADRWSTQEMIRRLLIGGVQVHRANEGFSAGDQSYGSGTYVVLAGQPFRGNVVDLFEAQRYPELRAGTTGPTKRPYDVAGWTLPMLMGVTVNRVDEPFKFSMERLTELPKEPPAAARTDNGFYLALADLLEKGTAVRWLKNGEMRARGEADFDAGVWEIKKPRVALYEPWTANMDTGWTQWVLDTFRIPYTLVHNEEIQRGGLRAKYDALILASQSTTSILHGFRHGDGARVSANSPGEARSTQRPEFSGGIGIIGLAGLESFVREGGTLIAFDDAAELPAQMFPLSVRGLVPSGGGEGSTSGYYCPGSLLRVKVDTSNPIAFGMPEEAIVFSNGGQAWDMTVLADFNKGDREIRSVAKYATKDLLASGWVSGERTVLGKHILLEASHGKGRVVLFGFRPQFRGQTFGTFKFILNSIYLGSAQKL